MRKKYLRPVLNSGGYLAVLLAIIGIVVIIYLIYKTNSCGYAAISNYWQMAYFSFSIIGAVGTLLAVIVALKKESLNKLLYSPDIKVEKASSQIVYHKSQNSTGVIEKYSMSLRITNEGTTVAKNCKLEINEIKYNKNRTGKKYKQLTINAKDASPLIINSDIISSHDNTEFVVFDIINPNVNATPSMSNDTNTKKALINIKGLSTEDINCERGKYTISYRLLFNDGEIYDFKVEIDWAGDWTDDIEEMNDNIKTEML